MERTEERTEHLSQFGVVNQVGPVSVDESTQSQAVLPAEPQQNEEEEEGRLWKRCEKSTVMEGC